MSFKYVLEFFLLEVIEKLSKFNCFLKQVIEKIYLINAQGIFIHFDNFGHGACLNEGLQMGFAMSEKIADGWESVDEKVLVFKGEPFWDISYHRFDGFGKSLGVEGNISYRVDSIFQDFGIGFMGG